MIFIILYLIISLLILLILLETVNQIKANNIDPDMAPMKPLIFAMASIVWPILLVIFIYLVIIKLRENL